MCWAHHFWLTIILSFHLFFSLFPDCVLMPLLGANSCSAFFHRYKERCDPERLTASSITPCFPSFSSIFTGIPRLIRVQFCFFHILSFHVKLAYLNTISVAEHIFPEKN